MPKLAANLSMMYAEIPFPERFEAAAKDGFKAVEYLFPYTWPKAELASRLRVNGLQQVLFNAPPGGTEPVSMEAAWNTGQRGTACLPGRESEFRTGVQNALDYAQALNCPRIHLMAGIVPSSTDRSLLHATYLENLRWAAGQAAQMGCDVLIEPINTRDIPGFFLNTQAQAHAVLAELSLPNLKVQMDLYHCQIVEGDLATKLQRYLPTGQVGHIQIAGVPERHEPDVGEVNYTYLLGLIDSLQFEGWVGCEYRPRQGSSDGLGWASTFLKTT